MGEKTSLRARMLSTSWNSGVYRVMNAMDGLCCQDEGLIMIPGQIFDGALALFGLDSQDIWFL